MTLRIQLATRAARAAAVLLAALAGCSADRAVDELSLVQTAAAAQARVAGEVAEDQQQEELDRIFSRRGHNVTSLLALHGFPHVKGMKEQLQEAAGFKMPPPEKGYHKKVVKALPQLQSECKSKPYVTAEDCDTAGDLLSMMKKVTEGPEPMWTWHGHLRNMMGLHFWLYTPGTMLCFAILDMDKSKAITYEEMAKLFGAQMMASMSPAWKFMDPDGDGAISREELHKYLRAAILVREVLPELDGIDPKADTRKCLNMAHRVLAPPPAPMKRMDFYPKLLSIAGIFIGAVALHCLFSSCAKSSKKAVFMDIVGFTEFCEDLPPGKVSNMLHRLYCSFDSLSMQFGVYKVETIGDAYVGVTNLVSKQSVDHAGRAAQFGLAAMRVAAETLLDLEDERKGYISIRVGFDSGPVEGNVIGIRNLRFSLFGDTVNCAARMESASVANHMLCTERAMRLLKKQAPEIPLFDRGELPIKGKGNMRTYWVHHAAPDDSQE